MRIIKKVSKNALKKFIYDINVEDEKLYEEINSRNKVGIFQMLGGTAENVISQIKPSCFEELNACNAFARPGTMSFVPQYVQNRATKKSPYPKQISDLLKSTNSIILFQEQVMEIFHKIGGFSLEETNTIRGLMKKLSKADKKKKDLDEWDKSIKRFQESAKDKGIDIRDAKKLADDMLKMSSYMFNRSHSVSYAYIAAMTLYLSVYFRKYFNSAVLHHESENSKKILMDRLISVKKQGFEVLPPDINSSKEYISPVSGEDKVLIFGLQDVKSVGEAPATAIVENAPYRDFIDFLLKTQGKKVTITSIKALISVGAFDSLYPDRKILLNKVLRFWEEKKSTKIEEKLIAIWNKVDKEISSMPILSPTTRDDLRELEHKYLGFNFFITPFSDEFMSKVEILKDKGLAKLNFREVNKYSAKVPVLVADMRVFNDRNGNEMAFVEIEDSENERISIPIFQSIWCNVKPFFEIGKVHMMTLYLNIKEEESQIMFGRSGFPKKAEQLRFVKVLSKL